MFSGETSGWKQPPASLHLVTKEDQLQESQTLGLHCKETWQLPSCKECGESLEVCNERQSLCKSWNRRNKLSQIEEIEKRIEFRVGGSPDESGSKYRRLRRGKTCYSSAELTKAAGLPEISEPEKAETCWIESDSMDSDRFTLSDSGFSESGELVEQEPWFPTDLQAEAIMDLRRHEPWEDFTDDVFDEIL